MTFIDPGQQALDNIDATVTSAPELSTAPGLTTDAALSGGDVGGSAKAVAQAAKSQVQSTAASGLFGDLGKGLSDVSRVLNAPLETVQHTYRYLHDVEARHGATAAILEGLGIATGVAVGSLLTGGLGDLALGAGVAAEGAADVGTGEALTEAGEDAASAVSRSGGPLSKVIKFSTKVVNPTTGGAVLGGEAAGFGEGSQVYKDSWSRTANGSVYRDPHTGQLVSFGRDIASGFLHLDHKSTAYNDLSGLLDAGADIYGDPLQASAQLAFAGHTTEGMRGLLSASAKYSGYAMTADNIQRKFDAGDPAYMRALKFFADTDSGSAIRRFDPRLAPIIEDKQVLHAATDPATIPDAEWYHGTATADQGFDPEAEGSSGMRLLRGPGLYMSDKVRPAFTYTLKDETQGASKAVYGLKWAGDHEANFMDLRKAGTTHVDDLAQSMKEVLDAAPEGGGGGDASEVGAFRQSPDTEAFWNAMNDPDTTGDQLFDEWLHMLDTVHGIRESGEYNPAFEKITQDLRASLGAKGYDGMIHQGGDHIGGAGKYTANVVFDPRNMRAVFTHPVEDSRIEKLMGLRSASTEQEAHSVIMNRSVIGGEAIGHRIPTMTGAKLAMTALRAKSDSHDFDAAHPIAGLLRPKTAIGNMYHLFQRVPVGVTGNLARLDDNLVQGYIQFWSAGVGDSAAQSAADLLPDLSLAGRRNVVRNMKLNTLAAMAGMKAPIDATRLAEDGSENELGLFEDPKIKTMLAEMFDKTKPPIDADYTGLYAMRTDGKTPRMRWDSTSGAKYAAGILQSQMTNDDVIPDVKEFRSLAKLLRLGHDTLGGWDQAFYDTVTARMKSLMLSTGAAYATHMALAEDVLNAQRLGLGSLIDGGLNASVQKSQWRALNADYDAIAKVKKTNELANGGIKQIGVVARSMRRAGRMLGVNLQPEQIAAIQRFSARSISRFVTEDDARYAAEFAILTNGHLVDAGLSGETNHGLDATATLGATQRKLQWKYSDRFEAVERGEADGRYNPDWQSFHRQTGKDGPSSAAANALVRAHARGAKEAQAVKEARAATVEALQAIPQKERDAMQALSDKAVGSPKTLTAEQDLAHDIVENVRGVTYSPRTMKPNGNLLTKLANGEIPSLQELGEIPVEDRPKYVPGRIPVPTGSNLVDRITESDFQHVAQPIIKSLARMPTATATYLKYRKAYASMVTKGLLTDEEAAVKAAADTTIDMVRFVHNPEDRVQLDVLMRNWAPFLFAQNQAYRRGLRLMADDPAAFLRYYRSIVGVANVAHQMNDGTGNTYISIPGAGYLTHPMVDAFGLLGGSLSVNPTGFGGTLSSANVIFPLSAGPRPDLAPIVLLPAQAINGIMSQLGNSYPGFSKAAQAANGSLTWAVGKQAMSTSFLDQVIPNALLSDVVTAGAADGTSFNSAMMNTMQNLDYEQRVATAKWIADGKKGPAPQIMPNDQASVTQKQEFLQKLKNQTRIVFLVRTLLAGSSPLGASVTVNDFGFNQDLQNDILKYGVDGGYTHFLSKHPYATAYTAAKSETAQGAPLPESDAAQQWVVDHQAQIKENPAFLYFMPQTTNQAYDPAVYSEQVADGLRTRDTPQDFLDKLYTVAGDQTYYTAYDQHKANVAAAGTNTAALSTEYGNWDAYLAYLQKVQPTWWASFNGGQKSSQAVESLNQLKNLYATGNEPKTSMTAGIGELLNALSTAEEAYVQAGYAENYATEQKTVRDNWQTQTAAWATANPALAPIINHLFRDALTYENPT